MERKLAWENYKDKQIKEMDKLATRYCHFLDKGKTERECVDEIVKVAEKNGYRNIEEVIKK